MLPYVLISDFTQSKVFLNLLLDLHSESSAKKKLRRLSATEVTAFIILRKYRFPCLKIKQVRKIKINYKYKQLDNICT